MSSPNRTLLVINCARDESYANRHVLSEIYASQFDQIAFAIGQSCVTDRNFDNIVQSWNHQSLTNICPCGDPTLANHTTYFHSFHTRLADAARITEGYDYVVFTEDDCLVSPKINSRTVVEICEDNDVVLSPLSIRPRDSKAWVWTNHSAGCAALDQVEADLDRQRLLHNWERYDCSGIGFPDDRLPIFSGFVDWMIVRSEFLRSLAGDLLLLRKVWHEIAIPTAVLHNTHRIGISNGLALWGETRARPLDELLAMIKEHHFVHPIKPSRYLPDDLIRAYDAIRE
jgi:hypothetical protein